MGKDVLGLDVQVEVLSLIKKLFEKGNCPTSCQSLDFSQAIIAIGYAVVGGKSRCCLKS